MATLLAGALALVGATAAVPRIQSGWCGPHGRTSCTSDGVNDTNAALMPTATSSA